MKLFKKGKDSALSILETVKKKKLVRRYILLILSLFISACYFNLLQLPTQIVTGGSSGVSIILNYYFNWDPSQVIFIISAILLIAGFIFLGFEKTTGALVTTIIYPMFVNLTANISDYIVVDLSDKILISIFIGLLAGITTGMVYKAGFSNGGFSIISEIISERKKIPISNISFIINFIIVILGGVSFGWTMVMYAAIILYINSVILDRVLIGVSKNKALYIITSEEEKMKDYIMNSLKHGITIFDVKGGFLEKKRKVLMTVIPNHDYFKLKEGIKEIDKEAFFIVTDSYQVYGGE
ncbi:MAG: YitT family protein [Tenericutes bacterium]|nr:YitT family protein [Mycoplasmatota bacterium]